MLNAEKNKEKILDITEGGYYFAVSKDRQNIARNCDGIECEDCVFGEDDDCGCSFSRMKWLLSEYKEPIKLSRLEYEILKWLEKGGYKFIVRSPSDNLIAYNSAPRKAFSGWVSENDFNELVFENKYKMLWSFNELFKFVKWEDEKLTSIKEVLDNCVVKDIKEEQ